MEEEEDNVLQDIRTVCQNTPSEIFLVAPPRKLEIKRFQLRTEESI